MHINNTNIGRLFSLICLALFTQCTATNKTLNKPNIVFILADDLGLMDLSIYGSQYYETPYIDKLASEGLLFTQAYASSPLCSPTRAALLTGKTPHKLKLTAPQGEMDTLDRPPEVLDVGAPFSHSTKVESIRRLTLKEYTIAEHLRDSGYITAFVGKWHLGKDQSFWAENQGFQRVVGGSGKSSPPSYFSPYQLPNVNDEAGKYLTDKLTDDAINILEDLKKENKPFFLSFWHYAVHGPFHAPKELVRKYQSKDDPLNRQNSPTMAAMIEKLDDSVGRIMDALDKLGLSQNTIVIFTSDNGGAMYQTVDETVPTNNAPLRGGKGTIYEGGLRIPLIVKWPEKNVRGRTDIKTISHDWYPTLATIANENYEKDKDIDGISIKSILLDEEAELAGRSLFFHFPHDIPISENDGSSSAIIKNNWKMIKYYFNKNGKHDYRLYDLNQKVSERKNLYKVKRGLVRKLNAELEEHLAESGALIPKLNKAFNPNHKVKIKGEHFKETGLSRN